MKLLTIRINNRINKKLNFSNKKWLSNNTFIIRDDDTGEPFELFSIKQDAELIEGSFHKKKAYQNQSTIHVENIQIDEQGNKVNVFLEKGKSKKDLDGDSFKFELDTLRNEYVFKMKKPEKGDSVQVEFCLEGSNNTFSIFLHFASIVYDAIVDFGSEASQACWYKDGKKKEVNITQSIHECIKAKSSKTEPQNESKKKPDDIKDYVQYENDTLYKSIYYMKEDLGDIELKPWPDYNDDSIKFLVSNKEELEKLEEDYFQLPNAKLTQFDISNYANMTVNYRKHSYALSELPNAIVERILLNNIVLQTLYSIQNNAELGNNNVWVVLNVLMPNVYPIHVISKKLDQLAKDIETLRKKDAYKNIKAVELRSVSESDASLLGHANSIISNTQSLNPGNYLIMDAGKGTLDFSLVKVDEHDGYVNRSKAGIIGAGNAITYGIIIGLVNDYLSEIEEDYAEKTEEQAGRIQEFIYNNILNEKIDVAKLQKFQNAVEKYKRVYNELYEIPADGTLTETETQTETEPNAETPADGTVPKAETKQDNLDDFTKWIESMCSSRKKLTENSCKYVTIEIKNIAAEAIEKMGGIFNCIHEVGREETAVDHVVFTGRGFLMKEFQTVMLEYLANAKIVKKGASALTPRPERMKAGCLDINQKLVGGQYEASASHQTIGLLHNISENNGKKQNKSESGRGKNTQEEKPDRKTDHLLEGIRVAQAVEVYSGDVEEDGIVINGITADSSLSIGGWLYTINKRFKGRKSMVFFDGIHYWINAEGVDPQKLGGTMQQSQMASPLCFETLFPNVSISSKEEIKIPKEREKPIIVQPIIFVDDKGENGLERDDEPEKTQNKGSVWNWVKKIILPHDEDDDEDESED